VLPIVVPLLTLGAAGYLARTRHAVRPTVGGLDVPGEPSPLTVLGSFLSLGEAPPLEVVFRGIAYAEAVGQVELAADLAELFLAPDAHDGHPETSPRAVAAPAARASGNTAAAISAAMTAKATPASSPAAPPLATWSRTYTAGGAGPAAATSAPAAPSGFPPVAAAAGATDKPTSSRSTSAETNDAAVIAAEAAGGSASAAEAPQGLGEIDAEAQRVLEMLADPASRAAKVEQLPTPASARASVVVAHALEALDELAGEPRGPQVEVLSPRPAERPPLSAADAPSTPDTGEAEPKGPEQTPRAEVVDVVEVLPRSARVPPIDVEAQRLLEELAASGAQAARVDRLSSNGARRPPDTLVARRSPIAGVTPSLWLLFIGRVSREAPTFSSANHVGRFRQRRERLLELGFDPAAVLGSSEAQLAALDADMGDAYKHASSSGLLKEYLGTPLELRSSGETRVDAVTLSGVLGVIQAAGLEGAVQWLERPADRTRFPHTTQAFLRCNGVF
jgi:hypothetical protein